MGKSLSCKLFLVTFLFIVSNSSAQWVKTNHPPSRRICCLESIGNSIISGTFDGNIFITSDNGENWDSINTGHTYKYLYSIIVNKQQIFVATDSGVYSTYNPDNDWNLLNSGLENATVVSFTIFNQIIFAGTGGGDIYASYNYGEEWKAMAKTLVMYSSITSMASNASSIFACSDGSGIFVSTDNGTSWNPSLNGIGSTYAYTLVSNEQGVYVGTWRGVFNSTDDGISWSEINNGITNKGINVLQVDRNNIFAGSDSGDVYLSYDEGKKWIAINEGIKTSGIKSLALNNGFIFAGDYEGNVWRRPLSELYTDVDNERNNLPSEFFFSQNYPNPFNPSTTIEYSIPASLNSTKGGTLVSLKIFDLLGREVATLVNEQKSPGNYEVKFDGSGLPSGVYFYKLAAGDYIETKKMLLLK